MGLAAQNSRQLGSQRALRLAGCIGSGIIKQHGVFPACTDGHSGGFGVIKQGLQAAVQLLLFFQSFQVFVQGRRLVLDGHLHGRIQHKHGDFRRGAGGALQQLSDFFCQRPAAPGRQNGKVHQAVKRLAVHGLGGGIPGGSTGSVAAGKGFAGGGILALLVTGQKRDRVAGILRGKKHRPHNFPVGKQLPAAARQQAAQQHRRHQAGCFMHDTSHWQPPVTITTAAKPQQTALRQ